MEIQIKETGRFKELYRLFQEDDLAFRAYACHKSNRTRDKKNAARNALLDGIFSAIKKASNSQYLYSEKENIVLRFRLQINKLLELEDKIKIVEELANKMALLNLKRNLRRSTQVSLLSPANSPNAIKRNETKITSKTIRKPSGSSKQRRRGPAL